jgi:hypothetical protein
MNNFSAERLRFFHTIATWTWMAMALIFVVVAMRPSGLIVVPMALILWFAARAERLTQSAQLVWPVLLLPGSVLCVIGAMQSMNYGRMETEPDTPFVALRLAFFAVGLLLHFAAYVFLATESRALDHASGIRCKKI